MNYPIRPVDRTTDFEGTTSLQPSQPVYVCTCFCLYVSALDDVCSYSLIHWTRLHLEMQFLGAFLVPMEGQ